MSSFVIFATKNGTVWLRPIPASFIRAMCGTARGPCSSSLRRQRPPWPRVSARGGLREGAAAGDVDDDVIALAASRESPLLRVVDDPIGAERSHELDVVCRAHGRDVCAERLGDLHRERPDSARGAVDEHLLSGLYPPVVAQRLQGGDRCDRDVTPPPRTRGERASARAWPRAQRRTRPTTRLRCRTPRHRAGTPRRPCRRLRPSPRDRLRRSCSSGCAGRHPSPARTRGLSRSTTRQG